MLPKERGAEEGRRRVHRTKSSTVSRWLMPVESCIDLGGAPQADNHLTPGKRPEAPRAIQRQAPMASTLAGSQPSLPSSARSQV
jgi:hypothetical protein